MRGTGITGQRGVRIIIAPILMWILAVILTWDEVGFQRRDGVARVQQDMGRVESKRAIGFSESQQRYLAWASHLIYRRSGTQCPGGTWREGGATVSIREPQWTTTTISNRIQVETRESRLTASFSVISRAGEVACCLSVPLVVSLGQGDAAPALNRPLPQWNSTTPPGEWGDGNGTRRQP